MYLMTRGRVVVVGVDDTSLRDYGPPTVWPPELYAQALNTLDQAGVQTVGLDPRLSALARTPDKLSGAPWLSDPGAEVGEGDTVKRTQVRVGARQNGRVEILQGVSPGQRIVTEGVVKITDGMKVKLAGVDNARPAAAR